jgi:hypothetical protein
VPLKAKGAEILEAMRKTYGSEKKAEQVFYASANKGTITGVHDMTPVEIKSRVDHYKAALHAGKITIHEFNGFMAAIAQNAAHESGAPVGRVTEFAGHHLDSEKPPLERLNYSSAGAMSPAARARREREAREEAALPMPKNETAGSSEWHQGDSIMNEVGGTPTDGPVQVKTPAQVHQDCLSMCGGSGSLRGPRSM